MLATAAYVYDQFNRLIKRTVDADGAGSGAAADQFFAGFEGINPTLIFDGPNSGDLTNRLLWGDIVDELFADEQITNPTSAGNNLWAASDHLGTIRDLVDFNGTAYTVANHRVYDSFGNLTSETSGSVTSLFGFTGKLFDKDFKLSNHWNRWYDPALGKWISEDPIGFAAGDANLGRYVGNRVLDSTDSLGLQEDGSAGLGKVVPQHIVDGAKTKQIEQGLTALGAFIQQYPDHFSQFQETYGVDGITDLVTALSWGYQVQFGDNWSPYWGWDIRDGSVISIDANTHWLPGQGGHSVAEDNSFLIRALRSDKLKAPKETPDGLTVGDFARWSGGDAHSGLRDAIHLVQEMIRETSEGIAEKVAETALEGIATKFAVTIIAGIRFAPNKVPPLRYKLGPNDVDWRGTGKTSKEALEDAFANTGLPKSEFEVTKWGKDKYGKSHPVEWRHKSGAEVNIDWPHAKNGPDAPHVGWQTGGKRGAGGAKRGHTILDEIPYNR